MLKINLGTLRVRTVKSDFKGTIERFVTIVKAFLFICPSKGTLTYWKQLWLQLTDTHIFSDTVMCYPKMLRTFIYYYQIEQPWT